MTFTGMYNRNVWSIAFLLKLAWISIGADEEHKNLWLLHVGGQEARPGWTVGFTVLLYKNIFLLLNVRYTL